MSTIMPHGRGGSPFDALARTREDGSEYWTGRDLQRPAGYRQWRRFQETIERARLSARNAGHDADTAFVQVTQLADAGNLGDRERIDYELSRFACYLVFMNGDPAKPQIADAQAYFAVQTRIAETLAAPTPPLVVPGYPHDTPTIPMTVGGLMVCVAPHDQGFFIDVPDIFWVFDFRDSDEMAAWLPEHERCRERVNTVGGMVDMWMVTEAGLARLLRERTKASRWVDADDRRAELRHWLSRGAPSPQGHALLPPDRRELT